MTSYVRFKYVRRFLPLGVYPATCPLNNRPFRGKGPSYKLTPKWVQAIQDHNSARGATVMLGASTGWVNAPGFCESLTMGGNIAEVDKVQGRFVKVKNLTPDSDFPDPANKLLFHKFTCLAGNGQLRLPAEGVDAFFPFLFGSDQAWIGIEAVDFFENMPEPIWPGVEPLLIIGYEAIVRRKTAIRQAPAGRIIGRIDSDTRCTVFAEVHRWAKIGDNRWVDLARVRRAS